MLHLLSLSAKSGNFLITIKNRYFWIDKTGNILKEVNKKSWKFCIKKFGKEKLKMRYFLKRIEDSIKEHDAAKVKSGGMSLEGLFGPIKSQLAA